MIGRAQLQNVRILCAREIQKSIRDSVHKLLSDQIVELKLDTFFEIQKDTIRNKRTGSEFIFKGLYTNQSEIKSTEGIDIVWIEEAERVSEESWVILIPTVRKEGSEIIVVFNPDSDKSATYKRFVLNLPPDSA